MDIREAEAKDIQGIHTLSSQLGYDYPEDKMLIKLNRILRNPDHMILVASEADEPVGYIHVEIYRSLFGDDLINIMGIVVDSSRRGRGVGTSLLKAAGDWAKERGCVGIRANSGSERTNAHLFYKRNGFDTGKDQKRFVKNIGA